MTRCLENGSTVTVLQHIGGRRSHNAQTFAFRVLTRVNSQHAFGGFSILGINRKNTGVGVGGAHHKGIGLPGQVNVVGITPLTRDQTFIFDAPHRLSDTELHHDHHPVVFDCTEFAI